MNAYIVTQWPLKGTVNDIWRLVYDYNIPTLVLLNDGPCSRVDLEIFNRLVAFLKTLTLT